VVVVGYLPQIAVYQQPLSVDNQLLLMLYYISKSRTGVCLILPNDMRIELIILSSK